MSGGSFSIVPNDSQIFENLLRCSRILIQQSRKGG